MRRRNTGFWKKGISDSYVGPFAGGKKSLKQRLAPLFWIASAGIVLGFLVILPALSIAIPPSAGASASDAAPPSNASIKSGKFTWWDRNTIHADINGKTYYFRANQQKNASLHYDIGSGNSACDGTINFDSLNPFYVVGVGDSLAPDDPAPVNVNVDMDWADPGATGDPSANCQDTSPNQLHHVSIGDPGNFDIYFQVSSDGRHLDTVGADGNNYTQTGSDVNDPSLFTRDSEQGDSCQDVIQVDKGNGTYKSYELDQNGDGGAPPASIKAPASCKLTGHAGYVKQAVAQKLGNADALKTDVNPDATPSGGSVDANNNQLGCDYSASPLTWIICPVVNLMVDAITATDNLITDQMNISTQSIFCSDSDSCQAYYSAWVAFRNIALGLMVIAGMLIVIAQALGTEILDAYTIRKTLPRLLIAAIAITLSWPLMNFAVTLSNDLGYGVRHLITAPFSQFNGTINLNFGHTDLTNLLGGGSVAAAAGVAAVPIWIAAGGLGVLLSYIATAGLAVLIAILVLLLRQIVVILLILISPIAIVAYILPNTNRIFRLWWESFSKALMMFPLIAAFIAVGRVFAAISLKAGDPVHGFIGFIAYFAPYFMIPLTFKFAGGALSGIGGFVNQRSQGVSNTLTGYRGNKRKERVAAARGGGLYRGANRFTKGLNTVGDYTLGADENLAYDFGSGNRAGRIGRVGGKLNPIGYAGRKLLGRRADELKGQIGHATAEHTIKAAQKSNLHYSAGWAALGMFGDDKAGSGLTPEGRKIIDDKYGTKFKIGPNGERIATAWKGPENGDYQGLVQLGQTLHEHSVDGSHAQYGGQELMEKAGTLSSFGLDPETKRATLQSVAGLTVAQEGKMSASESNDLYNAVAEKHGHGSVELAVADDLRIQREQAASQQGHDLRRGKGTRLARDGTAYSVYDEREIDEGGSKPIAAFKSGKALDAIMTLKPGALSAGKGDLWDRIGGTVEYFGGDGAVKDAQAVLVEANKLPASHPNRATIVQQAEAAIAKATTNRNAVRELIVQQSGIYAGSDPGAKVKVAELREKMGITKEEMSQHMGGGYNPDAIGQQQINQQAAQQNPPPDPNQAGPPPPP